MSHVLANFHLFINYYDSSLQQYEEKEQRTYKLRPLNDINIHCSVLIPMLTLIAHPDFDSINFSCGRNHTLVLREDISEMETAARKFEKEGRILEEMLERTKSNQDLYSYPLSNLFQKAEEEGYNAYCSVTFRLNPELEEVVGSYSQENEGFKTKQAMASGAADILSTEMSEALRSPKPINVRFSCFLEICFSCSQYFSECNCPSPPLVNIVFFGLSFSGFPSKFLKHVY